MFDISFGIALFLLPVFLIILFYMLRPYLPEKLQLNSTFLSIDELNTLYDFNPEQNSTPLQLNGKRVKTCGCAYEPNGNGFVQYADNDCKWCSNCNRIFCITHAKQHRKHHRVKITLHSMRVKP